METELESVNGARNPSFLLEWKSKMPTKYSMFLYLMVIWNSCHSGVTSLECDKGGIVLKGKDLGLRRRETSDPCRMEEEEGSHV